MSRRLFYVLYYQQDSYILKLKTELKIELETEL
jgi:hypothetical protein